MPSAETMWFKHIPLAPPDPIFHITASYNKDTFEKKVNVGVGAYRTEEAKPWVLPVVKKAEKLIVDDNTLDHEYLSIEGLKSFTDASAKLILGPELISQGKWTCVQTISGTGAVRMGAEFLSRFYPNSTVYLPNPTWANHQNIFKDARMNYQDYPYYNSETRGLDHQKFCSFLSSLAEKSIVLLHACAHNPTGVDPTNQQWTDIAKIFKERNLFPFFDCAYQGFASGDLNQDAWAVRHFASQGIELFVAQSFSKNFGLYNERCGSLTVYCDSADSAAIVKSQLNKITRPLISNPPAFGARVVALVLNNPDLYKEWEENLKTMAGRIQKMRSVLFDELQRLKTPGTWQHIVNQIGMFSFTGLTEAQCKMMTEQFHIYLTSNGRISMAGLNSKNITYFAESMDYCVRNAK